mmetsp:Transcript_24179/g.23944  ORF Transcript_24179/g.23944 Transcript_24179/m.23944 type:complete len:122 (-) Transcript_24179:270-635(-)
MRNGYDIAKRGIIIAKRRAIVGPVRAQSLGGDFPSLSLLQSPLKFARDRTIHVINPTTCKTHAPLAEHMPGTRLNLFVFSASLKEMVQLTIKSIDTTSSSTYTISLTQREANITHQVDSLI